MSLPQFQRKVRQVVHLNHYVEFCNSNYEQYQQNPDSIWVGEAGEYLLTFDDGSMMALTEADYHRFFGDVT